MKTVIKLLIFVGLSVSILILAMGCSTTSKADQARKYFDKAVKLDGTIVQLATKDIIRYKDSVRIKDSIRLTTKDSIVIIPKTEITTSYRVDTVFAPFDNWLGNGSNRVHIWSDGKTLYYQSTVDSLINKLHEKESTSTKEVVLPAPQAQILEVTKVVSSVRDKLTFLVLGLGLGIAVVLIYVTGSYRYFLNLTLRAFRKKKK